MPVPCITIITATFGRGAHIVPTIESALAQSWRDFEFLIVSDGDDAVTTASLAALVRHDPRLGLITLPWNSGSQATPNNVGLAAARGTYVAYLGHDDIWMPGHLEALVALLQSGADVAVSGCAYHGPHDTGIVHITGFLSEPEDSGRFFFPPSSMAHRTNLVNEIGGWRGSSQVRAPVDADLLLRAHQAGARFASTQQLTVHKFAAGHRYLSYLEQSSDEQSEMLERIRRGAMTPEVCAELTGKAKRDGVFMIGTYPDFSTVQPGELMHANHRSKGLRIGEVPVLQEKVDVPVDMGPAALDWYDPETGEQGKMFRWSGPSLRPKVLIPFKGDQAAAITLHLSPWDLAGNYDSLRIQLNGRPVSHQFIHSPGTVDVCFTGRLLAGRPSIVEIILQRSYCPSQTPSSADTRRLGIAMTGLTIAPG